MDSPLQLSLEELPNSDALEEHKQAIQTELMEQGSRIAKMHWSLTRDTALEGLRDCLGKLDALEWFAKAWGTANELRKLARETADDPDAEKELALAKHPLTVTLHPVITIHCDPIALPALRFTLALEAAVDCAVLIVRGGKLSGIEAAKMTPSAILSYGDHELNRLHGKEVELGRPYVFADGGLTII